MKNLSYIKANYFQWFKDIVDSKQDNEFLKHPDILLKIQERYNEYMSKFSNDKLILIEDSEYEKNHPELIGCYKSKTQKVNELLTAIRENQTDEAKAKCQYCGINKPKTIDHYLPISLYPEFAVLAINLLPCCSECNKKKDNYWKLEGERGILNFYVDNIPDKQFLFGSILFRNKLPTISFYLDFSGIDDNLVKIIENHYNRLELFDRYKEEASEEITEISRQLIIYSDEKSNEERKVLIQRDSDDLKSRYGKNYWKAVLRDALAKSDDYLNSIK